MPVNSSGSYVLPRNWTADAAAGTRFDSALFMEQHDDLAGELRRLATVLATLDAAVTTRITSAIGAAPGALAALQELQAAFAGAGSTASDLATALASKAPLASPALSGLPTAPTPPTSDESTRLATTAYVAAKLQSTTAGVYSLNGLTGVLTVNSGQIPEGANLYHTTQRAAAAAPVQSVAGRLGAVTIQAADVTDATPSGRAIMTAADAATARAALGLVIGTHVQAAGANLAGWAGIAPSAKLDATAAAASVAWANVTGRPINLSQFTNDAGYALTSGTVLRSITADNGGVISINGETGAITTPIVQDIRLGAETSSNVDPVSHVMTAFTQAYPYDNSSYSGPTPAVTTYRPIQKKIRPSLAAAAIWVTVTGS